MTALDVSRFCLMAATILVAIAALASLVVLTARKGVPAKATAGAADGATGASKLGMSWLARRLAEIALVFLTASIIARSIAVGHPPLSNQYEFAAAFGWGVLAAFVWFDWRYKLRILSLLVLPIAFGMLAYAMTIKSDPTSLPPALQNSLLLTLHVATASIGYGAAAVATGAAVGWLLQPHVTWRAMPTQDLLDEIGYRAIVVAFPMLTLMNILGAIWANTAWGRYWGWDPKETAALVTWLIYGAYLHARVVRDWRGAKCQWLLLLGFAAVLFTFFGNYFFGGLHSYGNR